jgi:adenine phosphoribosyltransferase
MKMQEKDIAFLDSLIRRVPDFPKKGILFYDISTLLKDAKGFSLAIDLIAEKLVENVNLDKITKFLSIESRGFIFGAALAYKFKKGLVIVRKEGKLPAETISYSYGLEYGIATVEMHVDAVEIGDSFVIVDDLLATGGTALATLKLAEDLGGQVLACAFLIELEKLGGRKKLEEKGVKIISVLRY